jgi:hypothetical protein
MWITCHLLDSKDKQLWSVAKEQKSAYKVEHVLTLYKDQI